MKRLITSGIRMRNNPIRWIERVRMEKRTYHMTKNWRTREEEKEEEEKEHAIDTIKNIERKNYLKRKEKELKKTINTAYEAEMKAVEEEEKWSKGETQEEKKRKAGKGDIPIVKRMMKMAKPERKLLAIGLGALGISSTVTLVTPMVIGDLVDIFATTDAVENLKTVALQLIGLFSVAGVAFMMRLAAIQIAGKRISARLQRSIFRSVLTRKKGFFDKTSTGELINRQSIDITIISETLTNSVINGSRGLFEVIGGMGLMFYISPILTILTCSFVPALIVFAKFTGKKLRGLSKKYTDALADTSAVATEYVNQIETVKLFTAETQAMKQYNKNANKALTYGKDTGIAVGYFHGGMFMLTNFAMVAMLYKGGIDVIQGNLTQGELTSFLLYSLYIGFAMQRLSTVYSDMNKAVGAGDRVFKLLDAPHHVCDVPHIPFLYEEYDEQTEQIDQEKRYEWGGNIKFENVSFVYPTRTDVTVLENLNLNIKKGEIVAIIGASGSGKSTIANLLTKLYMPTTGTIYCDDKSIIDIDPLCLRRSIGVVPQEAQLFSTTIRENIRMGDNTITDEEIEEACKKAEAHEFITGLPNEYETLIGDRGSLLSGGQRQRLAIARALVKKPALLILDESTSALDTRTEAAIQRALFPKEKPENQPTTIIIAHRLSTIQAADRIIVIQQGKVVEEGAPNELLGRKGGHYAALMQASS